MSITKRDRYIVNVLDNHLKCATLKQINMLPCFGKSETIVNRRLKYLKENELLNRQMYEIIGNSYVYYSIFRDAPKELEHSLVMTDVYIALLKCGYEILNFEIEKYLNYKDFGRDRHIIPDIMATVKDPNGKVHKFFVEISLDKKIDDIKKKYNIYKNYYVPQLHKTRSISPHELLVLSPVYRELEQGICIPYDLDSIEQFFKEKTI